MPYHTGTIEIELGTFPQAREGQAIVKPDTLEQAPLNFLSPEEMADPGITIKRLYAGDRVLFYEDFDPPFFVLSRYEDVSHVLKNPDRFLSGYGQGPNFSDAAGIVSDPPMHTFFRQLVQEDFKPSSIGKLRPRLETIADELLDAVEGKEVWDLHDELAFPLPVIIICEIFGIPTDDISQFKVWSDLSVAALSSPDADSYQQELRKMHDYILQLVREKRADQGDNSLMARIARARQDGAPLSDDDAVRIVTQLFVAGNETTTSLITNFMMRMLDEDYLWKDFCAGKIDMTKAINESLRLDPPLLAMFRTTANEEEIAGVTIPAHTKVMINYAAANRDPAVFENPQVFDPNDIEVCGRCGGSVRIIVEASNRCIEDQNIVDRILAHLRDREQDIPTLPLLLPRA